MRRPQRRWLKMSWCCWTIGPDPDRRALGCLRNDRQVQAQSEVINRSGARGVENKAKRARESACVPWEVRRLRHSVFRNQPPSLFFFGSLPALFSNVLERGRGNGHPAMAQWAIDSYSYGYHVQFATPWLLVEVINIIVAQSKTYVHHGAATTFNPNHIVYHTTL